MLSNDDRRAIEGLFLRLREVERRADLRDPEAEALIREEIARQPGAPYYMAQTILVQEHALEIAERRIRELEDEVGRAGRRDVAGGIERQRGPWDRDQQLDRGAGGFLAGAAQTALGVTGGILIGSAIASMFGGGTANAAESQPAPPLDQNHDHDAYTDAGDDDFGGFGGDGFDFGGDF
jgi:uncharacterized protein